MATLLARNTAGDYIFDANNHPLFVSGGTVYDAAGTQVHVDATTGNPLVSAGGAPIPQPPNDAARRAYLSGYLVLQQRAIGLATATGPGIPGPVTFARNPAMANNATLDYSTKTGSAIYSQGIKPLYGDKDENKFALDSEKLNGFLEDVRTRAISQGWDIFGITKGGDTFDLLTQHGQVDLADVKTAAQGIETAQDRTTQDDEQLFQCLYESLSSDAKGTINLRSDEYKATNERSGILLLKLIIAESQVETNATKLLWWTQLNSGMPDLMTKHGNDIKAFNDNVKEIQKKLRSKGEDPSQLMSQLLITYKEVEEDGPFQRYVEQLENSYSDGTINLDTKSLMDKAEAKYAELTQQSEIGKNKKKESEIVALQSELKALRTEVKTLKKGDKSEEGGGSSRRKKKVPAWVTKPPKDGETTKTVEGKKYNWCEGHGSHDPKWVVHDPAKCHGLLEKDEGEEKDKKDKKDKKNPRWSAAMSATVDEDTSDEE